MIIAIDPGNRESAYVYIENGKPIQSAKVSNIQILEKIYYHWNEYGKYTAVIEQVAGMGMAVGKDVFETCWWSGRFAEAIETMKRKVVRIPRRDVKLHLCGTCRAKDANIVMALVDRYDPEREFGKYGKGTKAKPGPLFGFAKDEWAALAVGLTYIDSADVH